jgi:hypothetical protein
VNLGDDAARLRALWGAVVGIAMRLLFRGGAKQVTHTAQLRPNPIALTGNAFTRVTLHPHNPQRLALFVHV